mmetsp:Transcript_9303/g.25304  ORF Transcript_9303/g.25304 Transcript_9303/m.25304 type:complete len:234 (+) Transcript_9303:2106-2807(+)
MHCKHRSHRSSGRRCKTIQSSRRHTRRRVFHSIPHHRRTVHFQMNHRCKLHDPRSLDRPSSLVHRSLEGSLCSWGPETPHCKCRTRCLPDHPGSSRSRGRLDMPHTYFQNNLARTHRTCYRPILRYTHTQYRPVHCRRNPCHCRSMARKLGRSIRQHRRSSCLPSIRPCRSTSRSPRARPCRCRLIRRRGKDRRRTQRNFGSTRSTLSLSTLRRNHTFHFRSIRHRSFRDFRS